ncbi:hypothetical protein DENSPDRAFT_887045 [Dentipellis sp. KUC8613]|nr:hypothetical protein DENSPDRAFT_887045 [Dentipellis sp. KUC8613]
MPRQFPSCLSRTKFTQPPFTIPQHIAPTFICSEEDTEYRRDNGRQPGIPGSPPFSIHYPRECSLAPSVALVRALSRPTACSPPSLALSIRVVSTPNRPVPPSLARSSPARPFSHLTIVLTVLSHPPTPSRASDRSRSRPTAILAVLSRPLAPRASVVSALTHPVPPSLTPSLSAHALAHHSRPRCPLVPIDALPCLGQPSFAPSRAPSRRRSHPLVPAVGLAH